MGGSYDGVCEQSVLGVCMCRPGGGGGIEGMFVLAGG